MFAHINQNQFQALYKKFKTGLAWMRMNHKRFDHQTVRFQEDVVNPMDFAWNQLSIEEKTAFLAGEKKCRI